MKKIVCLIVAVAMLTLALAACGEKTPAESSTSSSSQTTSATTSATTEATPVVPDPAFTGTVEEILDAVVAKAIELDDQEYGIGSIECTPTVVDEDRCESVLGLTEEEFAEYIEAAIESKPNGSWYTHSVVVIKLKDGVNVEEIANKIVANTKPNRFGCLKPRAIVGSYMDNFVIFSASSEETCEAVYSAVVALSKVTPTRIDRENDWSGGGLIG